MFWEKFTHLCNKKGENPTTVVNKLGISHGSVTHWKNGKTPHDTTLHKIADYFGVTVDFLLGREKKPSVQQAEIGDDDLAELISIYRLLDERGKGKLLGYAESLKPAVIEKKADIPVNRADIPADSLLSVARR